MTTRVFFSVMLGCILLTPLDEGRAQTGTFSSGEREALPCAAYGPGFVTVEGGDTCVRIDGHVRVGHGSSLDQESPNRTAPSAMPATMRNDRNPVQDETFDPAGRSRLRLPQSSGAMDPFFAR